MERKKKTAEDNSKLFQDTSSKAGKVLDKNRLYPTQILEQDKMLTEDSQARKEEVGR